MPKYLYLFPISFTMLIVLPAHVNFSSSGNVGLPVREQAKNDIYLPPKLKDNMSKVYQEDNMWTMSIEGEQHVST